MFINLILQFLCFLFWTFQMFELLIINFMLSVSWNSVILSVSVICSAIDCYFIDLWALFAVREWCFEYMFWDVNFYSWGAFIWTIGSGYKNYFLFFSPICKVNWIMVLKSGVYVPRSCSASNRWFILRLVWFAGFEVILRISWAWLASYFNCTVQIDPSAENWQYALLSLFYSLFFFLPHGFCWIFTYLLAGNFPSLVSKLSCDFPFW